MSTAATSPVEQLETVRSLVAQATQRLLGDTITVRDEHWRSPSRLPDWTRGHVATHLARNADAIRRLVEWARTGPPLARVEAAQVHLGNASETYAGFEIWGTAGGQPS